MAANSSNANSGDSREIPDLDLCFCDLRVVESYFWFEENAGRKKVVCPKGWKGCAYSRWIEPPHEDRSVAVIQKVLKELNDNKIRHSLQVSRIHGKHAKKIRDMKAMIQAVHTDDDDSDGEE
ncbi:hypothetical protein ACET3Z_026926 [Daucus carota]